MRKIQKDNEFNFTNIFTSQQYIFCSFINTNGFWELFSFK